MKILYHTSLTAFIVEDGDKYFSVNVRNKIIYPLKRLKDIENSACIWESVEGVSPTILQEVETSFKEGKIWRGKDKIFSWHLILF
jgi:hypothetical protein